MTLEEMKKKKIEYGLTGEMIAASSGVPLGTVQKIFGGTTKAPGKNREIRLRPWHSRKLPW